MSEPEGLDALPPDVEALIEQELAAPGPSPDLAARMHGKLAATVGKGVAKGVLSSGIAVKAGAGALLVGAVIASTLMRGTPPPPDEEKALPAPVKIVDEKVVVLEPMKAPAPPHVVEASKMRAPEPIRPARMKPRKTEEIPAEPDVRPQPTEPAPQDTLSSENALLEQARVALHEGRAGDALKVTRSHAESFPGGSLVEEREALEILALAGLRHVEDARAALRAFRSAHPRSIFLPVVVDAVDSLDLE